jgi:outer membrane protein OmpA-like peptidoglycan-associated protein
MESSLQSPQIASVPQPQQNEPAPPPPRQLKMPAAPGAAHAPPAAHLPAPPAPAPMPAAIGSARFEPPPPPPVLPPPSAPTRTASANGPAKSPGKRGVPPAAMPVAQIDFAAASTTLGDADRQRLGEVVPLYRRDPGRVRVVGYAGVGSGAVQQLNSFQVALDRAQAVAAALAKAGIPADKILVEAAPADADSGQGRAEILLEH